MRFPTPIQASALAATDSTGHDVVVAGPTGSGKTLAFLVPLLRAIAPELARREAAQLDAGGNLGLLTPAAAMATFSPALWTSAQKAAPARPARFGPPRGPPCALVVCPSRALAVQLATACFTLVGGTNRNQGSYFPGDATSLFAYKGPKGCRVAALASDADLERAVAAAEARRLITPTDSRGPAIFSYDDYGEAAAIDPLVIDDFADCDVLVADAATLAEALKEAPDLFETTDVIVAAVDEADVCGVEAVEALDKMGLSKIPRWLVGATLGREATGLARDGARHATDWAVTIVPSKCSFSFVCSVGRACS